MASVMKPGTEIVEALEAIIIERGGQIPPMPSPEEIRRIHERHAGRLTPVTVCECGWADYFHRMGCRNQSNFGDNTGHQIRWLFAANDGKMQGGQTRYLEHGKHFNFIEDGKDGIHADSGQGDQGSIGLGEV
nr:MAG TPA: hypothetical protein [Herelleviridae sp.]